MGFWEDIKNSILRVCEKYGIDYEDYCREILVSVEVYQRMGELPPDFMDEINTTLPSEAAQEVQENLGEQLSGTVKRKRGRPRKKR